MFKKIVGWLHLWLGLISGTIVFIVCITACIWVFNEEILSLGQPWKNIEKRSTGWLSPSVIQEKVEKALPGKNIRSVNYRSGEVAEVSLYKKDQYRFVVHVNPYSGEIVNIEEYKKDEFHFFDFILRGHRFLWFPWKIGRPIVNYATLTFVVILITGLILWWPKNKAAAKQRFKFQWKDSTKWKRKNYDLHNILGFYAMIFLLMIALTGITWGLEWFSKSVYWTVSGGDSQPKWEESLSDTLKKDAMKHTLSQGVDQVWKRTLQQHKYVHHCSVYWPDREEASSSIEVYVYPKAFDGFQFDAYSYDQYTLAEIPKEYYGKYKDAGRAEKLERMYYGIHVGSILGLTGKVIAFCAALIGASLPVTGIMIWWGRRKKEKKSVEIKSSASITINKIPKIKMTVKSTVQNK